MIFNTNDGTHRPPRLRIDINGANLFGLPATSSVPRGDHVLRAVKAAGFAGIQTGSMVKEAREAGLSVTSGGRINAPAEADEQARAAKDQGYDCYTVHVGWGIEDDDEVVRLVDAILSASVKHAIPIYIETHRATITQDMWRTVQLTKKFPDIRFNGDFSHYYNRPGDGLRRHRVKVRFMQPIFDRVRFIHGRIGNPACMQVDIGDGSRRVYVDHFKEMWTRSFVGFLQSAKPGDYICFTPELLGPGAQYARQFKNAAGELVEESDRWTQAILYADIARKCWDEAVGRMRG